MSEKAAVPATAEVAFQEEMKRHPVRLADGRYLLFYTFEPVAGGPESAGGGAGPGDTPPRKGP